MAIGHGVRSASVDSHVSMDDILASIRQIMSEEPLSLRTDTAAVTRASSPPVAAIPARFVVHDDPVLAELLDQPVYDRPEPPVRSELSALVLQPSAPKRAGLETVPPHRRTSEKSARALDRLAADLATIPSPAVRPPVAPSVSLPLNLEPRSASNAATGPEAVASPSADPSPQQISQPAQSPSVAPPAPASFEDTIAAMLRPLLRDWLDAHLPRMVEKALGAEMAERTHGPLAERR